MEIFEIEKIFLTIQKYNWKCDCSKQKQFEWFGDGKGREKNLENDLIFTDFWCLENWVNGRASFCNINIQYMLGVA